MEVQRGTMPKRKPVPFSPPLTHSSRSTQPSQPSQPFGIDDSQLSTIRKSNPNLQPLDTLQENDLVRKERHRSLDFLTTAKSGTSSPSSLSLSSSDARSSREQSMRHSIGSSFELKAHFPLPRLQKTVMKQEQGFWKYHIWQFGTDLYLTTNPSFKHLLCRNGPSFHVQIQFPGIRPDASGSNGFRMIFRDEVENSVFMTITKRKTDFVVDGLMKFLKNKEDQIVTQEFLSVRHLLSKEIALDELKNQPLDLRNVKPVRYKVESKPWIFGSIPQFRVSGNKMKDKRYIYFQDGDKIVALFRPHESRLKKRILSTLNKHKSPNPGVYHNSSTLVTERRTYYCPGDGLSSKNPPDDCPNADKLGWITVFDDEFFCELGNWELVVGLTLALGFSRTLQEL
jgi:hypothetical protein